MTADFFIDTNVLLYAQSKHPDETAQRDLARETLRRPGIAFSSQVLGEFYVNATRKISPPISHDSAVRILRKLEAFPILPIGPGEVYRALEIRERYSLVKSGNHLPSRADRNDRAISDQQRRVGDGQVGKLVHAVVLFEIQLIDIL